MCSLRTAGGTNVAEAVRSADRSGVSMVDVVASAGLDPTEAVRAAALRLSWQQRLPVTFSHYSEVAFRSCTGGLAFGPDTGAANNWACSRACRNWYTVPTCRNSPRW